jgi:septal ring factor EnvC (AmiA/AmiB activator)
MNLVGKILTALIALFSVVFMSFALAVYATHVNWRDRVMNPSDGLQAQLKKEQDGKKDLQGQLERFVAERDAERKISRDVAAALKTEKENLLRDNADMKKSLVDVQERERKAVMAMTATQNSAAAATGERDQLRKDLAEARRQREDEFKKSVALTDDLHQNANDLTTLKARNVTLVQDLQKYKDLLAMQGLKGDIDTLLQKLPPAIDDGRVMAVSGAGLIEISLGYDSGLKKGHQLHVYRTGAGGPTYLGKVEVVEAVPDRAVCKIIPEYQKGAIQKGDRIASKL